MKRKTISNISIFFLLAGLLSFGNWASAGAADLSLDEQCANVSQSVTFTITVDNAPSNVAALGMEVNFPTGLLEYTNYTRGDLVADWELFDVSEPDGFVRIAGLTFTPAKEIAQGASGTLVLLHFTVIAAGTGDLMFANLKDGVAGWTTDDGAFCPSEPDTDPPYTTNHNPASGTTCVANDTGIYLEVMDDGAGVDQTSIVLTVEGVDVTADATITAIAGGFSISYTPPAPFDNGQVVDVTVDAQDLADPPNAMVQDAYSLTVQQPVLDVDKTALEFGNCGIEESFTIANAGDCTLTWQTQITYVNGDGWINVNPESGTTTTETDTVIVTVNRAGLAVGNYAGTLTVNSNDGVHDIDVAMQVSAPKLSVTPTTLDVGENLTNLPFDITNTTGECTVLTWNASTADGWITVDPTGDTTGSETDTVTVTVDRSTLGVGPHTGTVTVNSDGGTQDVTILATVPPVPVLGLDPTALEFESWESDLTEKTFNISNQGTGSLEWSITPNELWITTTPTGAGTGPVEVKVKVNRTGQKPEEHTGTVTVDAGDAGKKDVAVTMDVGITISGTVWDILAEDEMCVPGARVSVVEHEAHGCTATCDGLGHFDILNVPPNEKMHIVILGPEPGVYVDTYSAYFTTGTENIQEEEVPILLKAIMDELVLFLNADKTKGIVAGAVETQIGDDFEGVAGAKVSITDIADKPIDVSVVYFDSMGEPDPALEETSSDGGYVVYNIGGVPKDVKIVAQKAGWSFTPVQAAVHPYEASPSKVTVAPVAGQEGPPPLPPAEGGGGGCFISTAAF